MLIGTSGLLLANPSIVLSTVLSSTLVLPRVYERVVCGMSSFRWCLFPGGSCSHMRLLALSLFVGQFARRLDRIFEISDVLGGKHQILGREEG
jgi:hypothetical protein